MGAARTLTAITDDSKAEKSETRKHAQKHSLVLLKLWRSNGENKCGDTAVLPGVSGDKGD